MSSLSQSVGDQPAGSIPHRTRLYRLEPIGMGTPMVECLASFIHRLAEAHGLPTWVLVRRELAPRFRRKSILGPRDGCELLGKMGGAINGNNTSALEAAQVLETLTGHTSLSCLTFARLRILVARRKIIRNCQAWCPDCLEDWRQKEQQIYQPLLWLLSDLTFCPVHGCRLKECCPGCERTHTPLGRYRWNGRCPRCWSWLGKNEKGIASEDLKPLSKWDQFVAASILPLMGSLQKLPDSLLPPVFPSNLTALIDLRFGGNTAAIARVLRATRRTIIDWAQGKLRPSLSSLLSLEYCFGAKAIDWITGIVSITDLQGSRPIDKVTADQIHTVPRQHHIDVVRAELARVVESNEYPPRSLRAVCLQLGFDQTVATRKCPELAQQIVAHFRMFQTERKRQHEYFMKIAVESAVNQLLHEGRSLSYHQLAKVLPKLISIRDKRVFLELKRLRKEAEDEMQAVMQERVVPAQTTKAQL